MFGSIDKDSFAVVLLVAELKDLRVSDLIIKTRESRVPLGIICRLVNIARFERGLDFKRYRSYVRVLDDSRVLEDKENLKVVLALFYAEYRFRKVIDKVRMLNILSALEKYLLRVKMLECDFSNYREFIKEINE